MLEKVIESFTSGLKRLKWFSTVVSERLKIELTVIKLLNEIRRLEEKRDDTLKTAGMRVFELSSHENLDILKDSKIKDTLKELEGLNKELDDLRKRIAELSQGTD